MKKRLVICGPCEIKARTEVKKWKGNGFGLEVERRKPFVIGEIDDNGNFKIKRGGENYTIIEGDNFTVKCGNCLEPVYRKEVSVNESFSNGSIGLRRFEFSQTVIKDGVGSQMFITGTV
jgi:hypothetical protein